MIGMAGINLPSRAMRTQIASAVHLICQVQRMRDGGRRVSHITEVVGMEGEIITTQDLFTFQFQGEGTDGKLKGAFLPSADPAGVFAARRDVRPRQGPDGDHLTMIGVFDPVTELALGIGLLGGITVLARHRGLCGRQRAALHAAPARGLGAQGRSGARRCNPAALANPPRQRHPGIDRIFQLLPRREMLVERLARTGAHNQRRTVHARDDRGDCHRDRGHSGIRQVQPDAKLGVRRRAGCVHSVLADGPHGEKAHRAFVALFPESIDLMVRALRAGLPITEAIVNAGQEMGDPIGVEFRGIEAGMKLGRRSRFPAVGHRQAHRVPEFRFFIIALSVQRETGGNLAETLNNLSVVLRGRRAMRAKARAMASEARASTAIWARCRSRDDHAVLHLANIHLAHVHRTTRVDAVRVAIGMLLIGVGIMVRWPRFEI